MPKNNDVNVKENKIKGKNIFIAGGDIMIKEVREHPLLSLAIVAIVAIVALRQNHNIDIKNENSVDVNVIVTASYEPQTSPSTETSTQTQTEKNETKTTTMSTSLSISTTASTTTSTVTTATDTHTETPTSPTTETAPVTTLWYEQNGETLTKVYSIPDVLSIPDGIRVIGADAFQDHSELSGKELHLEGIVRIEANAFRNCDIGTVYLSSDLEYIGNYAFGSDNNLTVSFKYDGAFDDFNYNVSLGTWFPFGSDFHLRGHDFNEKDENFRKILQEKSAGYIE